MPQHIFHFRRGKLCTAWPISSWRRPRQAIAARGRFSVALSGGSSPKKLYELLASPAYREQVPWAQVFFFFGDERNVPPIDPQSNYLMAKTALLAPLGIAADHVFAVNTLLPPAEAAQAYTQTINEFFRDETAQLDLVLLGLGDNSHTASLFPHTDVLQATTADAQAVSWPKSKPIASRSRLRSSIRPGLWLFWFLGLIRRRLCDGCAWASAILRSIPRNLLCRPLAKPTGFWTKQPRRNCLSRL